MKGISPRQDSGRILLGQESGKTLPGKDSCKILLGQDSGKILPGQDLGKEVTLIQTGFRSELEFLPKSSKDYGSLFCIGENAIGRQEEACVFQVRKLRFPDFPIFQISRFHSLVVVSDCANGEALPPHCLPDCQQDPHLP